MFAVERDGTCKALWTFPDLMEEDFNPSNWIRLQATLRTTRIRGVFACCDHETIDHLRRHPASRHLGGCKDFPGADGRYATHDRGANNRGGALQGLPVTPYDPR